MIKCIKVNGKEMKEKDMEFQCGRLAHNMRGIMSITSFMAKANSLMIMVMYILETSLMAWQKE